MGIVKYFETKPKVTLDKIKEMQDLVDLNFPINYIDHLLEFNGGYCEPDIFKFKENNDETESRIHYFLGIHENEYSNMKDYFLDYKIEEKRMPDSFFPFAYDPFGNLICIDSENGKVYFWDHEKEVDYSVSDDTDHSNLYFVADSFEEFIDSLE